MPSVVTKERKGYTREKDTEREKEQKQREWIYVPEIVEKDGTNQEITKI